MRRRRKFYRDAVNHVYQSTVNWNNIFYCYEDFLVFFTIFSVCAKCADVCVLGLCLMYDHIHSLTKTENRKELSAFVDRYTAWYVQEYNHAIGRKGKKFHKKFGSAPKWGDKTIRSAINYVGNNPVEKKICSLVQGYRWNFLAYAASDHPFSKPYISSKASRHLRNAIREVRELSKQNLPLKYVHLKRMMKRLSHEETEQFVDQVIKAYLPIDFDAVLSYYGTYEEMIIAMNANTGSEHDIREEKDYSSHTIFTKVLNELSKHMSHVEIRKVTIMPEDKKRKIFEWIKIHFNATPWQICKFLHIKL